MFKTKIKHFKEKFDIFLKTTKHQSIEFYYQYLVKQPKIKVEKTNPIHREFLGRAWALISYKVCLNIEMKNQKKLWLSRIEVEEERYGKSTYHIKDPKKTTDTLVYEFGYEFAKRYLKSDGNLKFSFFDNRNKLIRVIDHKLTFSTKELTNVWCFDFKGTIDLTKRICKVRKRYRY